MRSFLKWLGFGLCALVGLGLFVAAYAGITWWRVTSAPLPDYSGEARVEGLTGEVVIRRDEYAIPHIEADSEADAWFALGFVHAQDRLFQMDFMRRAMSGRLAALMGPAAVRPVTSSRPTTTT